jgi:glycerol-1-phosphate dehydrogenase [NAD(P)+]
MQHHTHNGKAPSHGFKVGIGTLASTALYEYLLPLDLAALDVKACCARWPDDGGRERTVRSLFSQNDLLAIALRESRDKWTDAAGLQRQLDTLRRVWPALQDRLRQQLLPMSELKGMLSAVGAPVEPEQIGISRRRLRDSYWQAGFMRSRFTMLDVAFRCSLLRPALDHIFGPQGPWPIAAGDTTQPER